MDDDTPTLLAGTAAEDEAGEHLRRDLDPISTPARQSLGKRHQRILGERGRERERERKRMLASKE